MKSFLRNLYPLVIIAVAAVGILYGIFLLIGPRLNEAPEKELQLSLLKAIPGAASFAPTNMGESTVYIARNTSDSNIGFVFKGANKGYGGPVETLTGITNGAIDQLVILSLRYETPGLGSKAGDNRFQTQFSGLTNSQIPLQKSEFKTNGLDAISGATLTSLAVVLNIRSAFQQYQGIIKAQTNTNSMKTQPLGTK